MNVLISILVLLFCGWMIVDLVRYESHLMDEEREK